MNTKPPSDNEDDNTDDDNTDDDKSLDKNVSVSSDTLDILQGDFLITASQGDVTHHNDEASLSAVQDALPRLQTAEAALRVARAEILRLTKENKNLKDYNSRLKRKHEATGESLSSTLPSTGASLKEQMKAKVTVMLDDFSHEFRLCKIARVGTALVNGVWSYMDGLYEMQLIERARKYYQENVFTPFNVLRAMDLGGGRLSYEGLEVVRTLESSGKKYSRGIIPSSASVKRIAAKVEHFGNGKCPFTLRQTSQGEAVRFDYAKKLDCMAEAFHLREVGKLRPLSIGFSIDGASFSKNLDITIGGCRITDREARDPLTQALILHDPNNMKAQSRTLCEPMDLVIGKETIASFQENFTEFFDFMDSLGNVETLPEELKDYKHFLTMVMCDLSAGWKGLGYGGAAKQFELSCTCCDCKSDFLAVPNSTKCSRWCHERDGEWQCFHKHVATPEVLEKMECEAAELKAALEVELSTVEEESKMVIDDVDSEVPTTNSKRNTLSIHFQPESTQERQQYSSLLTAELRLRNLDLTGGLSTRRERLRLVLNTERTLRNLLSAISHGTPRDNAMFILMSTIPCVLHGENRVGIKVLYMLLNEGLSNCQ
jgi:hypothetical protein